MQRRILLEQRHERFFLLQENHVLYVFEAAPSKLHKYKRSHDHEWCMAMSSHDGRQRM
jgi:hypothetical protein